MAIESAIVRIRKSNGIVVGAGFLVTQKHVITCAHVIADALGISRDTQTRPTERIYIDFPLVASEEKLTARVIFWRPVPPKGSTSVKGKEDIAALEIYAPIPSEAEPVDLLIETDLRDHRFRTFGFPVGHDDGLEATGVLRGQQATGWVQIEDVKETGVRLEPGFSGAPIWDEQLNGIVGMAIAADQKRPEAKVAFMIPIQVIASTWTPLSELTTPPLSLTKKKHFRLWRDSPLVLLGLIAVLSLSVIIFKQELQEFFGLGESVCFSQAHKQKKLIIAVADFSNKNVDKNNNYLYTKDRIFDRLRKQRLRNVEICPISQSVPNSSAANKLGKELNAEVVIWGRYDPSAFEVNLEAINQSIRHLNSLSARSDEISNIELQIQDWPELINVMAAFAVSKVYFAKGEKSEAQKVFKQVLDEVNLSRLNRKNKSNLKVLARAYFFLGLLFREDTSNNCENTKNYCLDALSSYEESSKLDSELYEAFLSKGILYWKLGNPKQALKAFAHVIKFSSKSSSVKEARSNRAKIYMTQNNYQAAIEDLKIICEIPPSDEQSSNYCHWLGIAQLKSGQTIKSIQTYKDIQPFLDQKTKEKFVDDLRSIQNKKLQLASTINSIIEDLLKN